MTEERDELQGDPDTPSAADEPDAVEAPPTEDDEANDRGVTVPQGEDRGVTVLLRRPWFSRMRSAASASAKPVAPW